MMIAVAGLAIAACESAPEPTADNSGPTSLKQALASASIDESSVGVTLNETSCLSQGYPKRSDYRTLSQARNLGHYIYLQRELGYNPSDDFYPDVLAKTAWDGEKFATPSGTLRGANALMTYCFLNM